MALEIVWTSLPKLLDGLWITVQITVIPVAIGLAVAVPLALMRVSRNPLLRWPVYGYIFYFRGTPLLVQLFLIYYGASQFRETLDAMGLWVFFRERYFGAMLALTLNTAAYTAEILRGSIQAVPHGEVEAAHACGMSGFLLYRRIILPRAFRLALPAYANEVVFLFQATSLVSLVSIDDLTGVARAIIARSFAVYEIYIAIAIMYLIVTYGILWIFRKIEFRWTGHLRARPTIGDVLKATGQRAALPQPILRP
jgi:His/Glu/Gln/Arg/opine family amino acid ABC transporter permease subunit